MSDCRFGVSPVNYPDPDSDPDSLSHVSLACHFRCLERNWKNMHKEQRVSLVFAVRKQSGSYCSIGQLYSHAL